MSDPKTSAPDEQPNNPPVKGAWWTVCMLTTVTMVDWADRALVAVTADPIKQEFSLTDTQLGLLMGAAFVAVKVIVGLPIGRLADSRNRRNITAISLAVVSAATIAFGLARAYGHLFVARIFLGSASAGTTIPALSMISDLFPLRKRGFPMGVWATGGAMGWALGVFLAGAITQAFGWRMTMYCFGAVGVVFAIMVFTTVAEPVRRSSAGLALKREDAPSIANVLSFLLRQRSFLHVAVGMSVLQGVDILVASWGVSFFLRSHGLSMVDATSFVGLALLIGGLPGTLLGGRLLDAMAKRDIRWHCWGIAGVSTFVIIPLTLFCLSRSTIAAAILLTIFSFVIALSYAAVTTISMGLLGSRMRAIGYAIFSIVYYLGYAIVPFAAGFASTRLEPYLGNESLRYGMLVGILFLGWSAIHFWRASRTLTEDYARADAE